MRSIRASGGLGAFRTLSCLHWIRLGLIRSLLLIREVQMDQQDRHSKEQEHISDVEDPGKDLGPPTEPVEPEGQVPVGKHMEEIPHATERQTVPEVSQCTGEDEADPDMSQSTSGPGLPSEDVDRNHDGHNREHDEESTLFTADSEDRSRIENQMKVQHSSGDENLTLMKRNRVVGRIVEKRLPRNHDGLTSHVFKGP